ncbi:MAG: alanine--tRNA ligase [bacterium]|nr:alanine--tRNA ligase [bacterium]
MTSKELREKFLAFFEKNGHKVVPSSSLVPTDPSVLFTTAGMQQFKPYYLGQASPYGKNAASSQKCFRTSDIEEVGDERHLTFFEMLGNFSFGGYEKEEAIKLAKDFLDSINLKIDYVTVFGGDKQVPRDEESARIWEKLGFSEGKGSLKFCGREDNFWGPTGEEGPCGPTTEIYSKGIEVWNIVFNQYYCNSDKTLKKLDIFGVDTGMGLERLAMASQGVSTVFETDLFLPIMNAIPGDNNDRAKRVIADHIKAAVFLISEGILPSNVERGYVLRRILRRAIGYGKLVDLISLVKKVTGIYEHVYPALILKQNNIIEIIEDEFKRFEKVLERGEKEMSGIVIEFKKSGARVVDSGGTLRIEQSLGVPFEIQKEFFATHGIGVQQKEHEIGREKHQELSRTASAGMFKGGLADTGKAAVRYHTATHLLLAVLRQVLGPETYQKGSNITAERLRFDFNYPQKMTEAQIKEVEDSVNKKIQEGIPVEMVEMPKAEAIKIAKISFDPTKYGEKVKVYKIGDFSIELCGGPHVKSTAELGKFKIMKEESSGAGVRRIRAVLTEG